MTSKFAKMVCLSLVLFLGLSGCNTFPTPTESSPTITPEPTMVIEPTEIIDVYGCNNPSLTPEEVANCGQHVYATETNIIAGDCYLKLDDGSSAKFKSDQFTYTIVFESGTMSFTFDSTTDNWTKIHPNIYEYKRADTNTVLEFTLEGFDYEFTDGDCKIVRQATITQETNGNVSLQTITESRVRYILADIQLGDVANYYSATGDADSLEAIRRWNAGVRVTNIHQFERKLVDGQWQIVYSGTETTTNGMDIVLSSD